MARMLALATIWTLPFGLVSLPDSHVELAPLLAVIVLGVVGTGVAYLLMGSLVGRVGPTRASFITYLIPVVSLVLGVVFRDDHVAALAVVGVGLVVDRRPPRRPARAHLTDRVASVACAAGEAEGAEAPVGEERGRRR